MAVRCVKGREQWSDRQMDVGLPPTDLEVRQYFQNYQPDVVIFIETPFNWKLTDIARKYGIKTVAIIMHETCTLERAAGADLIICPCQSAWDKIPLPNKILLPLPIGLDLFPHKQRDGHVFVFNMGYGGVNDRRQSVKTLAAFSLLRNPEARLIINSQVPTNLKITDKRIELREVNYPEPKQIYADGDIALLPIAYGGYERMIPESMASGMPTLTMDADPMNTYQPDLDLRVRVNKQYRITDQWVYNTVYNEVSIPDLLQKMEWLIGIDTPEYSLRARNWAEAQSWESTEPNYKAIWLQTLGELCSA